MKLQKILLSMMLLFLPLGVLPRFHVSDSIFVNPIDVLSISLLIVSFFWFVTKKNRIDKHPLSKAILLLITALTFSLAVNLYNTSSTQLLTASLYLIRFISYVQIVYIFYFLNKKFLNQYLQWLAASGLISVLLGFVQFFLYKDLKNLIYLGWDEHLYRMFSTYLDPNFAGILFTLTTILLLENNYSSKINNKLKNVYITISTIAIILTFSRTAYVSFISVLASKAVQKQKKSIAISVTFTVVILLMFFIFNNITRGEGLNLLRTQSINARILQYRQASEVFLQNPLLGVGFNNYRDAQIKHGFTEEQTEFPQNAASGVPNSYLFVLATSGVVGLASLAYFLFSVIKQAIKQNLSRKTLIISTLTAVMIGSIFENALFYNFIMFWTFSVIGISFAKKSA